MVVYNFKNITPVPLAPDFIDAVLNRVQRKTPTVIRANFAIHRIRSFYMRKVRFTQQTYSERIQLMLDEFPKIDDIHPFYAALINVLYDQDYYKIALGQLNMAKQLIDKIGKDYVRLLKFANSLFQCKQLKRAAMGRMSTLIRRHKDTFKYLEDVRQHLSRLPCIDPDARTLLVTGYPNVGKTSFVNKITRVDGEVQAYAFTTKSLFVGHTDYRYGRWQVIDTPGILDKPLDEATTIEMQAITALAHLRCAVLYFFDISEQCGFTLEQQLNLFNNIKPLFTNKPLVVVANKVDVRPLDALEPAMRSAILSSASTAGAEVLSMSNMSEEGIMAVRNRACDILMDFRNNITSRSGNLAKLANRVTIVQPKPRDDKDRPHSIPESVLKRRARRRLEDGKKAGGMDIDSEEDDDDDEGDEDGDIDVGSARKTERDLEREAGGAGKYNIDLTKHYDLADPAWRTDLMPVMMDGKNVFDFIDPDILERLEELERQEDEQMREQEELEAKEAADRAEDNPDETRLVGIIRQKRALIRSEASALRGANRARLPRTKKAVDADTMDTKLSELGVDASAAIDTAAERTRSRGRSLTRRAAGSDGEDDAAMAQRGESQARAQSLTRSQSRARSLSRPRSQGDGLANVTQRLVAEKSKRSGENKFKGKQGESDRFIGTKMPKHLFSGKRGIGTTDRR